MRPSNIFRRRSTGESETSRRPSHATVVSYIALFFALGSGAAYAANTIASGDIIDGEVKTADIGQGAVKTDEVANGQVTVDDIGQGAVKSDEVANGTLTGGDVQDNSLKGADIDESSLVGLGGGGGSLPKAVVVTDSAAAGLNTLGVGGVDPGLDQVIQTSLPTGNWVVEANATFGPNSSVEHNISCGLYDANNPLTEGNTHTQAAAIFSAEMSLTGVSDGGIVRLACATDPSGAQVRDKILVATQVGTVTVP